MKKRSVEDANVRFWYIGPCLIISLRSSLPYSLKDYITRHLAKCYWDDEITSEDTKKSWTNWIDNLPKIEELQIPKFILQKGHQVFQRPSNYTYSVTLAFSAVTYLRVEDEEGVNCSLIGSNTRVGYVLVKNIGNNYKAILNFCEITSRESSDAGIKAGEFFEKLNKFETLLFL